jgi:hypothetical protein
MLKDKEIPFCCGRESSSPLSQKHVTGPYPEKTGSKINSLI